MKTKFDIAMSSKEEGLEQLLRRAVKAAVEKPTDVMLDRQLAQLGDAYLNFICSLAASLRAGKPRGFKVSNRVLAQAAKNSGLRTYLPNRLPRHEIGGAIEALLIYAAAWEMTQPDELIQVLSEGEDLVAAFTRILTKLRKRLFEA